MEEGIYLSLQIIHWTVRRLIAFMGGNMRVILIVPTVSGMEISKYQRMVMVRAGAGDITGEVKVNEHLEDD